MIWKFVFQTARNTDTNICRSLNGSIVSNQWEREICRYPMNELKDLRTRSKEGETRSWTQKEPERKMSNDEVYHLEREEKETRSWTQKDIEGKMSDDEACHLERKEKEKEFEIRRKQMEERKKEIKAERVKTDREKVAKEGKKGTSIEMRDEDCGKLAPQARVKVPAPEKGLIHAEVNMRKNGMTYAEMGLTRDDGDPRKKEVTLMCDKGDTKVIVEAQQVWEHDSHVTIATETSPVHSEMPIRVGVLHHPLCQCEGDNAVVEVALT